MAASRALISHAGPLGITRKTAKAETMLTCPDNMWLSSSFHRAIDCGVEFEAWSERGKGADWCDIDRRELIDRVQMKWLEMAIPAGNA